MKQVIQDLRRGGTTAVELPLPALRPRHLLVQTKASLISTGTERMLVDFGRANLIDKARQQPDKVRMVLDKARTDGVAATLTSVRAKLDKPLPLGYSSAGVVVAVGEDVDGWRTGDRIVSNGPHAEFASVPVNLCARIPDTVDDETASFTVVGAIALQGVRLAAPTIGETVAVIGLGLIGLLTVQILRAGGCRVIGIDPDVGRARLAETFGAVACTSVQDPLAVAHRVTEGRGVDAVLITACTSSDEPVHQAARMCRQRGRIVLVGVTGLKLSRADFYEKELSFQVSCSYGPGRYDPAYEEQGVDYPFGFVRWTEQRNFQAVLDLMASGAVRTGELVEHRFPIEEAAGAYDLIATDNPLAIVLRYPDDPVTPARLKAERRLTLPPARATNGRLASAVGAARANGRLASAVGAAQAAMPRLTDRGTTRRTAAPRISVIGAGGYASQVLLPALAHSSASLRVLVSAGGLSSTHGAKKHGFAEAATDPALALADPRTDAVLIATRHDSHARYVIEALRNHKHVFVEKPLAIKRGQLEGIRRAWEEAAADGFQAIICTGFNRRFSPHTQKLKALLEFRQEPASFVMTVNAGAIPADHWTQDPVTGGGRIIGEACHFIDLLMFLAGSPLKSTRVFAVEPAPAVAVREDKATLVLHFADGSMGTIHYLANGHRSLSKERLEVFCGGAVLQLDNFRRLRGYGWPGFSSMNLWRQDKGNQACVLAFVEALKSGAESPVPLEEAIAVTQATFDAADTLRQADG